MTFAWWDLISPVPVSLNRDRSANGHCFVTIQFLFILLERLELAFVSPDLLAPLFVLFVFVALFMLFLVPIAELYNVFAHVSVSFPDFLFYPIFWRNYFIIW